MQKFRIRLLSLFMIAGLLAPTAGAQPKTPSANDSPSKLVTLLNNKLFDLSALLLIGSGVAAYLVSKKIKEVDQENPSSHAKILAHNERIQRLKTLTTIATIIAATSGLSAAVAATHSLSKPKNVTPNNSSDTPPPNTPSSELPQNPNLKENPTTNDVPLLEPVIVDTPPPNTSNGVQPTNPPKNENAPELPKAKDEIPQDSSETNQSSSKQGTVVTEKPEPNSDSDNPPQLLKTFSLKDENPDKNIPTPPVNNPFQSARQTNTKQDDSNQANDSQESDGADHQAKDNIITIGTDGETKKDEINSPVTTSTKSPQGWGGWLGNKATLGFFFKPKAPATDENN